MKKYQERFEKHYDELKWLYCELYENRMDQFQQLCEQLKFWYESRSTSLKKMDNSREEDPQWYQGNRLLGMMMYVDMFAGNLEGVREKLDYVEECGVNYLHLMPLMDTPEGRSDGGYAVADFRKVRPDLGTIEDLGRLCTDCHERNISVCLDFVMNHTSEDHEWAVRAKAGEREYQDRYYFYDNFDIPSQYEATVPQVFPTTAPGNFTFNEQTGKYVMTTFYPYQWDLNYGNPVVLNEMIYNMLFLVNLGVDIIRIDAVPYIWKQLGTNCRNLPQVHNIVRIMRIICEIVCPGVLLLGEVVMEPDKVVPYFGTTEKPECHMLYNVTTMATTWNCIAMKDTRLLKMQMDVVNRLPKEYIFLNYLRCHDDIGWGLDFDTLGRWGMEEIPHKRFLNEYFQGKDGRSFSRGELYNDDPVTQDARFCGTTASMCGVECAGSEGDEKQMSDAIRMDIMLHAYMMTQSGIPVIYSGDEIGQVNDHSYKKDPDKCVDSRYIHRGKFRWDLAKQRGDENSVEGRIFRAIDQLGKIRKREAVFLASANVYTYDVHEDAILCILREKDGEVFLGIFNFSDQEKISWMKEDGIFQNLLTGEKMNLENPVIPGHGFYWLKSCHD